MKIFKITDEHYEVWDVWLDGTKKPRGFKARFTEAYKCAMYVNGYYP